MSGRSFIERTLQRFAHAVADAMVSEQIAARPGLLQTFDPRVRVVSLLALVITVTLCRRILVITGLLAITTLMAIASQVSLSLLAKRVWLVVIAFTGIIAIPALFLTPGPPVLILPSTSLAITKTGLHSATLLILRVETAASLTTLLVLSTPWTHILKSFRSLHLPAEVVTMLAMTHRYVFLLIETANQMFESRQSRMVGSLSGAERRRVSVRTAGVLLSKSIELSNDVYLAMLSRGFRGEIYLLTDFRMRFLDYAGLTAVLIAACAAVWIGR